MELGQTSTQVVEADEVPYGGRTLVADTSAWTNIRKATAPKDAQANFMHALRGGQICVTPLVLLEMIWGANRPEDVDKAEALLSLARGLPLTPEIINAAISGVRSMVGKSHGYQRVPFPDALVAATAQKYGYGVLHYDRDFDRLAPTFGIDEVRVAPKGSIL